MKKLIVATIGLGLVLGSISFAAPNKAQETKSTSKKKKKTSTAPKM
jgi:hypothetical protein